jgi:prepilin-type N-terminal cleavage/methylation domain-containing protein
LLAPVPAERGLLNQDPMDRSRLRTRLRTAQGFSLIELLMVVAIIGILAAVALGITSSSIRAAKGAAGTQQLSSFLKRHRELSISRRRNIQIDFTAPNMVRSTQLPVPDPPNPLGPATPLETMYLEGRMEYQKFAGVGDTPDAFGNAAPVNVGPLTVMFTSEGSFVDANGNVINASVFLGVPNQVSTASAVTIVGVTAAVRLWRWDGMKWVQ